MDFPLNRKVCRERALALSQNAETLTHRDIAGALWATIAFGSHNWVGRIDPLRHRYAFLWHERLSLQPQPAILTSFAFLNGRFSAKNRTPDTRKRTAAEVHHIRLARQRFDDIAMAGAL